MQQDNLATQTGAIQKVFDSRGLPEAYAQVHLDTDKEGLMTLSDVEHIDLETDKHADKEVQLLPIMSGESTVALSHLLSSNSTIVKRREVRLAEHDAMIENAKQRLCDAAMHKRQRGRPRLYAQHLQTDRRRAQIRHAQRTYREKKERRLEDLNTRINILESSVAIMKYAFFEIYDEGRRVAIRYNDSNFAEVLANLTTKVLAIAKDVAVPSEDAVVEGINISKELHSSHTAPLLASNYLELRLNNWSTKNRLGQNVLQDAPSASALPQLH